MRTLLGLIVWLLPAALAIWCIVRLFRNRNPHFLYQWQRGRGYSPSNNAQDEKGRTPWH